MATLSNPSVIMSVTAAEPVTVGAATGNIQISHFANINYASGTGASQADQIFTVNGNITAAASPLTYQISSSGALVDPAGNAVAMAHWGAIIITNLDAVKAITIGGGSNPLATIGSSICEPGCTIIIGGDPTNSQVVTPSTGDIITLTSASGATNTHFKLTVIGRSA